MLPLKQKEKRQKKNKFGAHSLHKRWPGRSEMPATLRTYPYPLRTRRLTMKSASSRSAKQPSAKKSSSSMKSKTDWARIKAKANPATPTKDHPEADIHHSVPGVVRRGRQLMPP